MIKPVHVTVCDENLHERENPIVAQVYPEGMHPCIADGLRTDAGPQVTTFDEPGHEPRYPAFRRNLEARRPGEEMRR